MDLVPQLRSVLDASGYTAEAIAERLDLDVSLSVGTVAVPVHLRRLTAGDRLDSLIRLFLLNVPLGLDEARATLDPVDVVGLEGEGVLGRDGADVRSLLRIMPYASMLFAYDAHDPKSLRHDSVMGWTSSARALANMTVRRRVGTALDVGTGSGVQALLAAHHARRVVAVDLNPHALWLTDLNCRLNGVSNVECRQGDLFEPVRGESFELVVSNPPFVISPGRQFLFRDAVFEGDGMSEAAVTGAADVLRDGGFAHVMVNWVIRPDERWWTRPAGWVEGRGCDALLLHYDTFDPLGYAAAWNEDVASGADELAETLDGWLDYYRSQKIEAIAMGAVILRRRAGDGHWFRTAPLGERASGSASGQVERIFAAEDWGGLDEGDDVLLGQRFAPVDGHRLEQVLTFRQGEYVAEDGVIVLDEGLGLRNRVEPQALHVLLRMDGVQPLGELVRETAEETGLDDDQLAASTVACVRELFGLGFLERLTTSSGER